MSMLCAIVCKYIYIILASIINSYCTLLLQNCELLCIEIILPIGEHEPLSCRSVESCLELIEALLRILWKLGSPTLLFMPMFITVTPPWLQGKSITYALLCINIFVAI